MVQEKKGNYHANRKGGTRRKSKSKSHKSRPRFKACDPFSGRSYPQPDESKFDFDPDSSELEDAIPERTEGKITYLDISKKPSYRRGGL